MNGSLLIGGGLFTHEQIDFGRLVTCNPIFHTIDIRAMEYEKDAHLIDEDFVVILGMKGMVRTLLKRGFRQRQIRHEIETFFLRILPRKAPLVVVDDFSLSQAKYLFKPMLRFLSKEFNLKLYLLREYLRNRRYPAWVQPFSLPTDSYSDLRVNNCDKMFEFFFHGNASSRDRLEITNKLEKNYRYATKHLVVTYGGVKNTTERLAREDFLNLMARSKLCLDFPGSGYDCYRYHEIASVGSVITSPDYPLVRKNDYKDMESCIKYRSFRDLKKKIDRINNSNLMFEDMVGYSVENFEDYHTSEKRAAELLEYITSAVGN